MEGLQRAASDRNLGYPIERGLQRCLLDGFNGFHPEPNRGEAQSPSPRLTLDSCLVLGSTSHAFQLSFFEHPWLLMIFWKGSLERMREFPQKYLSQPACKARAEARRRDSVQARAEMRSTSKPRKPTDANTTGLPITNLLFSHRVQEMVRDAGATCCKQRPAANAFKVGHTCQGWPTPGCCLGETFGSALSFPVHPKQELCHNKALRKQNPARHKPA